MKHGGVESVPEAASTVFGSRADIAAEYARLLATAGVERGLIGPRECERLWDRHLLNSAAIAELIPDGRRVADIGSGAGLPGIPLAIARPDLRITLIEPLLRRATFLTESVAQLGLGGVVVVRGRAEDAVVRSEHSDFDFVISRAVAALDKVARWSLPLLRHGGEMLAIKGERAGIELEEHRNAMLLLGVSEVRVVKCGEDYLHPPTTVVVARRNNRPALDSRSAKAKGRKR